MASKPIRMKALEKLSGAGPVLVEVSSPKSITYQEFIWILKSGRFSVQIIEGRSLFEALARGNGPSRGPLPKVNSIPGIHMGCQKWPILGTHNRKTIRKKALGSGNGPC